jgi:hypothetical protein
MPAAPVLRVDTAFSCLSNTESSIAVAQELPQSLVLSQPLSL